jgi:hypothetical protein
MTWRSLGDSNPCFRRESAKLSRTKCYVQRIGGLAFTPNNVGALFVAQMPLGGQPHQLCDNAASYDVFAHFVSHRNRPSPGSGLFLQLAIQLNPT